MGSEMCIRDSPITVHSIQYMYYTVVRRVCTQMSNAGPPLCGHRSLGSEDFRKAVKWKYPRKMSKVMDVPVFFYYHLRFTIDVPEPTIGSNLVGSYAVCVVSDLCAEFYDETRSRRRDIHKHVARKIGGLP